jgi:hypothetical protein
MNLLEKGQQVSVRWPLKLEGYDISKHEFILKVLDLGDEIKWPASAAPFFMAAPSVDLYLRPSHYEKGIKDLSVPQYVLIANEKHFFYFPENFGSEEEKHTMFWNTYYLIPESIDFDVDLIEDTGEGFADVWTRDGILMFEAESYSPVLEGKIVENFSYNAEYIQSLEFTVEKIKAKFKEGYMIDDALDIDVYTGYLMSEREVELSVLLAYRINKFYLNIQYLKI